MLSVPFPADRGDMAAGLALSHVWAQAGVGPGRNSVRRNDGSIEILSGCAEAKVEAGEAIEIVTPTGGGWSKVERGLLAAPLTTMS
jgi:N-methylhydantoinase B/oxoprolinase/acetone carboxylase alpha subunit